MGNGAGEFGEVQPVNTGGVIDLGFKTLTGAGLNYGTIQQITPIDAFKKPQQIDFTIGIANPLTSGNYMTALNLKLWWARPNKEYRAPGTSTGRPQLENPAGSGWAPIDQNTFHGGPNNGLLNNRYIWVPSGKRLDTTPYDVAPLPVPPQPNSYSEIEDDVLRFAGLPDPTDPVVQALFPAPQIISRWVSFLYPARGLALGLTYSVELFNPQGTQLTPQISLTWQAGDWGGATYTENEG